MTTMYRHVVVTTMATVRFGGGFRPKRFDFMDTFYHTFAGIGKKLLQAMEKPPGIQGTISATL